MDRAAINTNDSGKHGRPGPAVRAVDRLTRAGALPLLVLQLLVALPFLGTVPRYYNDEAWEASLGQSLAFDGALRHPIIEGWGGMHVRFVQNQVVLPFVCAPLFKVAGVSVLTARLASVLMSLLAVGSIHAAMRRWFGPRPAFFITAATIIHPWFFEVSRRCRPEIYYIALGMAALATALRAIESDRRSHAIVAGVLAGLACLAHPTGVVFILAIAGGVFLALRPPRLARVAARAALGFAAAILPYGAYVAWAVQDPRVSFREQMQGGKEAGVTEAASLLEGEFFRWGHYFQWPSGAPVALIVLAAWVLAWVRSNRADRCAAAIVALFALAIPLASVNTTSRYLIALTPFLVAMLVRLIVRLRAADLATPAGPGVPARRKTPWTVLAVGIAGIYFLSSAGGVGLMFQRLWKADVYRFCDRVAAVTGPDARVYGRMILWIGGDRYRYGPFPLDHRWRTTFEMLAPHRYDFAVRTAWNFGSSGGVSRPPATMPAFRAIDPVDRVCERYGVKVDEFRDAYFGPAEVYRLNWEAPPPVRTGVPE